MGSGSPHLLEGWHILDCLWPEEAVSVARRNALESLGCNLATMDCSEIGTKGTPKVASACVFVLSNLNWRSRQWELAVAHGCPNSTLGAYSCILCSFLRAIAPTSHILVLARRSDMVMEALLELGMPLFVQPLCASHEHRAIVSTASDAVAAPVREIWPGEQLVGVLAAPSSSLPFEYVYEKGFRLDAFLATRVGQVWFLGEGDSRLATHCADVKLAQSSGRQSTGEETMEESCTKKRRKGCSEYAYVHRSVGESEWSKPLNEGDHAFVAALLGTRIDFLSTLNAGIAVATRRAVMSPFAAARAGALGGASAMTMRMPGFVISGIGCAR